MKQISRMGPGLALAVKERMPDELYRIPEEISGLERVSIDPLGDEVVFSSRKGGIRSEVFFNGGIRVRWKKCLVGKKIKLVPELIPSCCDDRPNDPKSKKKLDQKILRGLGLEAHYLELPEEVVEVVVPFESEGSDRIACLLSEARRELEKFERGNRALARRFQEENNKAQ